jgi:predicted O-linked N-acetylglucosamine transferase (SPINDLY family)
VVETWAQILKALPDAKLILKASGFNCDITKRRYLDMFETHGVSADRISCRCASSREELWLEYQQVDIQLDPFPFSGSTTTLESLWMGVPVLTMPQETFASRHSFSYLSSIGLTDFVASGVENYIQIATDWSHRLEELSRIRQDLRPRMAESPLCDAETFSREFYQKLREVWQTYVSDHK